MSSINDSIINNSFSSRDEDVRDGNDFELRAEDMREDSRGEEFAGSIHEGEFEAVAQKRRLSPKKIAIGISLILVAAGGAGFLAHTLQARNGSATEPDFADLKAVMQTNQPVTPMVSTAVPAEGVTPVEGVAAGDQAAGVSQVAPNQSAAVSVEPSAAPSIPMSPIAEVNVASAVKQAPAPSVTPVSVPAPVSAAPVIVAQPQPAVAPAPVVAPAPAVAAAPVKVAPVVSAPAKAAAQTEKKPAPTAIAIKKAHEPQTKNSSVIREPSIKPRASEQPSSSAVDAAAVINDVKPLVTVTANQIGLKSLTKDMLLVANGATTHRYSIGDLLPSGERIVFIDSHAATIVTDKQIIRVAN